MVQLVNTSIHKVKTTPETNEYPRKIVGWFLLGECKIRHVGDSKLSNWDSHENLGHRNSPATAFFLGFTKMIRPPVGEIHEQLVSKKQHLQRSVDHWLFYFWQKHRDEIWPSYIGITTNYFKHPCI